MVWLVVVRTAAHFTAALVKPFQVKDLDEFAEARERLDARP